MKNELSRYKEGCAPAGPIEQLAVPVCGGKINGFMSNIREAVPLETVSRRKRNREPLARVMPPLKNDHRLRAPITLSE